MENTLCFALLWMIANVIFAWPFIVGMWRRNISMHPYSWLLWILVGGINAYGLLVQGNEIAFVAQVWWMLFWIAYCIYWFATEEKIMFNWIDGTCLLGGLAAVAILIIFWLTEAIVAIIIVDIIAIVPTWKKIFYHPESDRVFPWFWCVITLGLYLLSVQNVSFESISFWIYLITVNVWTGFYILARRKQLWR